MRAHWRKTTAILVVTSHVLAITVAGAFHQHGSQPCGGCETSHHAHQEHSASCCHHEQASACVETPDETQPAVQSRWSFSPEGCPVCQFLAQKWITVELSEAERVVDSVWEKALGRALRLQSPLLFSWQIRGPPVAA